MNISTATTPNGARERFEVEGALQAIEEIWQANFASAGGGLDVHCLNEFGQELFQKVVNVPAQITGALGFISGIPVGQSQTYKLEAYCLNAPVFVGMCGTADATAPHTANYTTSSPTAPEILYPGDKITWGIRGGPRIERAYNAGTASLAAVVAASVATGQGVQDLINIMRDIRYLAEVASGMVPLNTPYSNYP